MRTTLVPERTGAVLPAAAPKISRRPRLVALDGLRLVAALLVVFHHYVGYGGGPDAAHNAWGRTTAQVFPTASRFGTYTWTGVELFFLISGFVICMSSWGRGLGAFFVSRVVRLYPAYWFAVLATTAVLTLWPVLHHPAHVRDVLLNLTMLHEPLGVGSVDAVYWTLWVEMRFYLLFALVVWKGLTYRRVVAFCLLWSVASVFAGRLPFADYVVMPEFSSYFVAGIAMYLMYRHGPTPLLWGIVLLSWLFSVNQVARYSLGLSDQLGHPMREMPAIALMTLGYLAMIALALGKLSWLRGRWLTIAGALTYPLYLMHEEIGWTAIRLLHGRIAPWPLVGLLTAGMLLAAWLVHRLVERPLSRALKHRLTDALAATRERAAGVPVPDGPR
ncbi:acyltransferase [Kitasatospora sp. NPDC049285]|uniref:acyltransferase family protein n=1 Tax=Kitasatospora sp. NPDC049285 TaxID=3157096 RepID=UPI00342AD2D6